MLRIITPTLGTGRFLDETIATVYKVELPSEHIIVSPSSMVSALSLRFPESRVIAESSDSGIYSAINDGLKVVTSREKWRYFTYINDDDRLGTKFNEYFSFVRDQKEKLDIVYGRVDAIDDRSNRLFSFPVAKNQRSLEYLWKQRICPLMQQGMLVSREVYDKFGGFDRELRFSGDLEYVCRMFCVGCNFLFYPKSIADFRFRSGQLSEDRIQMKEEENEIISRYFGERTGEIKMLFERIKFRVQNFRTYYGKWRSGFFTRSENILGR